MNTMKLFQVELSITIFDNGRSDLSCHLFNKPSKIVFYFKHISRTIFLIDGNIGLEVMNNIFVALDS